jgi:hypothetical protein
MGAKAQFGGGGGKLNSILALLALTTMRKYNDHLCKWINIIGKLIINISDYYVGK